MRWAWTALPGALSTGIYVGLADTLVDASGAPSTGSGWDLATLSVGLADTAPFGFCGVPALSTWDLPTHTIRNLDSSISPVGKSHGDDSLAEPLSSGVWTA